MADAAELPVQAGVTAMDMAEAMFGTGIQVVSATYQGDPLSAGIYSDANTVIPGVAPSDSGVILSTGYVADFTNSSGEANQSTMRSTNTAGVDGDPDVTAIAGYQTYDAAIFSTEFIPAGSTLTMQITFSSEEYLEYVGSGFNDAVGVWVNGQKAVLAVGDGDISVDNINPSNNGALYVDNAQDQFNTEMDGFTVTLTLKAPVNPGQVNTIKIGIADGGDAAYDSNLMIAAESVQTAVIAGDDCFDVPQNQTVVVDLLGNDSNAAGGTLTITKINGQPVVAGSVIALANGLEITVNGDGTITVVSDGDERPGQANFSYEVTNAQGLTDVGFVKGVVACFVAGAMIDTLRGPMAVEAVMPGDMVFTRDHGFQPVRWSGRTTVASAGELAAVVIPSGTLGNDAELRVSPQHRLLLTGWRAELHCGEHEVLVKAIHLVRCGLLRQDRSARPVTYCHLMFDRHEIIRANGMWSESCYPDPRGLHHLDPEGFDELVRLFPAMAGDHPGPVLARMEAQGRLAGLLVG